MHRRIATAFCTVALMLAGCTTPRLASERLAAAADKAMVSTPDPRATDAGVTMLAQGGSAADAALAVALALTVVEPQSSGIGGGGFLLYHDAKGGLSTIDGRETAPAQASPGWFLDDQGQRIPFAAAVASGKSIGVPGTLHLMATAHARWGRLPWASLFQPAIRLARDGFIITPRLANALARHADRLKRDPAVREIFFTADGAPKTAGTLLRNPALAATLEQLARHGSGHFYRGGNARAISAASRDAHGPARITEDDLARYTARERPPVCGDYRSYRICGMGPPSAGGIAVVQILKQLEGFDLGTLGADHPDSWHLIAESMRLAYADRARYAADGDFVSVPVAGLTDPAYIRQRASLISQSRAMTHVEPGVPPGAPQVAYVAQPDQAGTSHFAVADRHGHVASYTSTVEGPFGAGRMVGGYFLNNELTDFSFQPDENGQPVANRVEAGKRPRSAMSPTIVYDHKGKPVIAVGAAGGPTIIAQVAKTLIGVIDWKLGIDKAIALPLLIGMPDRLIIEADSALVPLMPALTARGHKVGTATMPLKANGLMVAGKGWQGAADPRSEGTARGPHTD